MEPRRKKAASPVRSSVRSDYDGCVFPQFLFFSNERNKSIIVIQIHFIYPQECYPHSNLLPSEVVV